MSVELPEGEEFRLLRDQLFAGVRRHADDERVKEREIQGLYGSWLGPEAGGEDEHPAI